MILWNHSHTFIYITYKLCRLYVWRCCNGAALASSSLFSTDSHSPVSVWEAFATELMKHGPPKTWTNPLNIANNLNLRLCQCDTLHFLGRGMGLWEGFTSIIGYALMLAVSISFVPHFGGKKIAVNRDSLVFFFLTMNTWFSMVIILGIVVSETLFERFKRCYPRLRRHEMSNASEHTASIFWIHKSRKMLASYPNFVHGISSSCAPFPYSASTMLFSSSRSLPPFC